MVAPATGAGSEFDLERKRAAQREAATLQGQKDALARRAAQTGGGVSGALIKQEQVATNQSAQRLGAANEAIDAGERAEARRLREIQEGRDFTRSEREASQGFLSGESALQRRYLTGEREAGQAFSSGEADKQRGFLSGESALARRFQTGEREASERNASGEAARMHDRAIDILGRSQTHTTSERVAAEANALKMQIQAQQNDSGERARDRDVALAQLGLSRDQFDHQKNFVDPFNMRIAELMATKRDFMETLLSPQGVGDVPVLGSLYNKGTSGGFSLPKVSPPKISLGWP